MYRHLLCMAPTLNKYPKATLRQNMSAYTREDDDVQEIEAWMVCGDCTAPAVTKFSFLDGEDEERPKARGMLPKVVKAVRSLHDKTPRRALGEGAKPQASTPVRQVDPSNRLGVDSFHRRLVRQTSAARRFMDRDFLLVAPLSPTTTTPRRSHQSTDLTIEQTPGENMTQYSDMRPDSPTIPPHCMVFRPLRTSFLSVSSTETLAPSLPSMSAEGLARTMNATRQLTTVVAAQDDAIDEVDEIAEVAEIMRQRAELDNRLLAIQSRQNAANKSRVASPEQTNSRGTSAGLTSMNSHPTSTHATTHVDETISDDNKASDSVAPLSCATENNASATRTPSANHEHISSPTAPLERADEGRNAYPLHTTPSRRAEDVSDTHPLRIGPPRRLEEDHVFASFNTSRFSSDSTPTPQATEDAINDVYQSTTSDNNNARAHEDIQTTGEEDKNRKTHYDKALQLLTGPDPDSVQDAPKPSPPPSIVGQGASNHGPLLPAFSWALPHTPTEEIDDVVSLWIKATPPGSGVAQHDHHPSQNSFADVRSFVESELKDPATSPAQPEKSYENPAVSPLASGLKTPKHHIFPAAHVNDSPSRSPKVRFFDDDAQLQLQKARGSNATGDHGKKPDVLDSRSLSEACLSGQPSKPGKEKKLKQKFSLNFRSLSSPFRSSVREEDLKSPGPKGFLRGPSPPLLLPSKMMLPNKMPPNAMPSTRMLSSAPSFNVIPSNSPMSSSRLMSSSNLASPSNLTSPSKLTSSNVLVSPSNLASSSNSTSSNGLVSPSKLISSSDLIPSDTTMPSSSNAKAAESPNSPHSLYDFAAFEVKQPPMLHEATATYRKKYGLPEIRCRAPDDPRHHPKHIFEYETAKLACDKHEGRCAVCKKECCLLRQATDHLQKNIGRDDVDTEKEKELFEMVQALKSQTPKVFDVFPRMLSCSSCRRQVCPECAGRCEKRLCNHTTCKNCASYKELWKACDCYL